MEKFFSDILSGIGFKFEEFPDGYFWHLSPKDNFKKIELAIAIGFDDYDEYDPPDTVILQCNAEFENWQYVCDADYGSLSTNEATKIIEKLRA